MSSALPCVGSVPASYGTGPSESIAASTSTATIPAPVPAMICAGLYVASTGTEPVSASATSATKRPEANERTHAASVAKPGVGIVRRMRSSIPFPSVSKKSAHVPKGGSSTTRRSRSMSPPRPAASNPTSSVSPAAVTKPGRIESAAAYEGIRMVPTIRSSPPSPFASIIPIESSADCRMT